MCAEQRCSGAQAYLVIKLEGGRRSAKAAAAVTQLPFRLEDCQLGLLRAVRRAQRNLRDLTNEREIQKKTSKYNKKKNEGRMVTNISVSTPRLLAQLHLIFRGELLRQAEVMRNEVDF